MTIEFHKDRDFDEMFERLVNEMDHVANASRRAPSKNIRLVISKNGAFLDTST